MTSALIVTLLVTVSSKRDRTLEVLHGDSRIDRVLPEPLVVGPGDGMGGRM